MINIELVLGNTDARKVSKSRNMMNMKNLKTILVGNKNVK